MKIIKINLLILLMIAGVNAYAQESNIEPMNSEISNEVKDKKSNGKVGNSKSIVTLDLNKAYFANKGVSQISNSTRWEDSLIETNRIDPDKSGNIPSFKTSFYSLSTSGLTPLKK